MNAPPEDLAQWAKSSDGDDLFFHATAVAVAGQGALILGASGAGKSSLALELLALGAELISDDGVWVRNGRLCRPEGAPPFIEARGVGLLHAGPFCPSAPLSLVIDLSRPEPERLPPRRMVFGHDQKAPLILAAGQKTLAPKALQLLRRGRAEV